MPPERDTDAGSKKIEVPIKQSNINKKEGVGGAKSPQLQVSKYEYKKTLMKAFKMQLEIMQSVTEHVQNVLSPVCSDDEEEEKEVEQEDLGSTESEENSQDVREQFTQETQDSIQF